MSSVAHRTFDDIAVVDSASVAGPPGDRDIGPSHRDEQVAKTDMLHNIFGAAHSAAAAGLAADAGQRMSHVFATDASGYPRPLLIPDAALTMHRALEDKRDIVHNAIESAHAPGLPQPRAAIPLLLARHKARSDKCRA